MRRVQVIMVINNVDFIEEEDSCKNCNYVKYDRILRDSSKLSNSFIFFFQTKFDV